MRILTLGDVHCDDKWKIYVRPELIEDVDKIVFLGDYVDSFTHSNEQMITNLLEIINFKQNNPDKVILLWANHDIQYRYYPQAEFQCSGLRSEIAFDIKDIFKQNESLFQNAYQYKDHIWTHAGMSNYWFISRFKGDLAINIADQLNNPKDRKQEVTLHDVGYMRGGCSRDGGGIFWCDRQELKKPLQGFTQIVGHTRVDKIKEYTWKNSKVYFCDCLESGELLTLEL